MHNILIVIVLYNENLFSCMTYNTLISSTKDCGVYIYDNSPQPQHLPKDIPTSWEYISNTTNPGLSYAYNRAAEYALENGYEWILLTDQDTVFAPHIIDKYIDARKKNPDIKLFVPQFITSQDKWLSPIRLWHNINLPTHKMKTGRYSLHDYSPINSGIMVNVDSFCHTGGYDESVFLDYSDFQFIEKFKEKYPDFFLLNTICVQNFSNEVQSKEQKFNRYRLFCRSLRDFRCSSLLGKLGIHFIVIKRCCSLSIRNLSFLPISIIFNSYFKR